MKLIKLSTSRIAVIIALLAVSTIAPAQEKGVKGAWHRSEDV
jgi:hypothetical protein